MRQSHHDVAQDHPEHREGEDVVNERRTRMAPPTKMVFSFWPGLNLSTDSPEFPSDLIQRISSRVQ